MTKEKIAKLESIEFRFYIGKGKALRTWDIYFNALVKFKENHGHTNIPLGHRDDPNLGKWAYQQRLNFSNHFVMGRSITPVVRQRIDQLKAIGFNFHVDKRDIIKKPRKRQKREKKYNTSDVQQNKTDTTCCAKVIDKDTEDLSRSSANEPKPVEAVVRVTEE